MLLWSVAVALEGGKQAEERRPSVAVALEAGRQAEER